MSTSSSCVREKIGRIIAANMTAVQDMLRPAMAKALARAAELIAAAFRRAGFLYLIGNGGSAADAQHIAAELSGRFQLDRAALPAIALTTNPSALTAIANDLGYEQVFARQLEGLLRRGDVLFAISTSGTSPNILAAVRLAKKRGAVVVAMTGEKGGTLRKLVAKRDVLIAAPSDDTPRIQECHCLAGHIVCKLVEDNMSGKRSAE